MTHEPLARRGRGPKPSTLNPTPETLKHERESGDDEDAYQALGVAAEDDSGADDSLMADGPDARTAGSISGEVCRMADGPDTRTAGLALGNAAARDEPPLPKIDETSAIRPPSRRGRPWARDSLTRDSWARDSSRPSTALLSRTLLAPTGDFAEANDLFSDCTTPDAPEDVSAPACIAPACIDAKDDALAHQAAAPNDGQPQPVSAAATSAAPPAAPPASTPVRPSVVSEVRPTRPCLVPKP